MTRNHLSTLDEQRWLRLDDGTACNEFIYAVITTGIYCRPGCPSRHPNRDNVRFFDTATEAEEAGFRPCKRCRPEDSAVTDLITTRVTHLCRYIENAAEEPSLQELADHAGISIYHLQRQFKKVTGTSPKQYAKTCRQKWTAGGRKRNLPMTLFFSFFDSSLGLALTAGSEAGFCAILLGDDEATLEADLRKRFPNSELQRNHDHFSPYIQLLVDLFETAQPSPRLPLDIRGTLFQQKVWAALQAIPAGETRSYSDIAVAIGSPTAVRAVAGACAANALALAIPCHRIIRNDGGLSGYRWGVARKEILLQREAKPTKA